jgi:hypothetical protein
MSNRRVALAEMKSCRAEDISAALSAARCASASATRPTNSPTAQRFFSHCVVATSILGRALVSPDEWHLNSCTEHAAIGFDASELAGDIDDVALE